MQVIGHKMVFSIKEVDFGGHATLAAVHVLFEEGLAMPEECIRFSSNVGQISATTHTNERYLVDFLLLKVVLLDLPQL